MSTSLTEADKKIIQESLLESREIVLHADDLVGSPNLQPALDTLCARLDPFCAPDYNTPGIALNLGALHERVGAAFLEKGTFPPEAAYYHFDQAAAYFEKAAAMISTPANRFTPSHAKLGLAQLYEVGFIGPARQPNLEKAFGLLHVAAQEGCGEAQMFLAFAYFEGRGTQSSITEAVFWINAAFDNRAQLDEYTQQTVSEGKEKLEKLYLNTSPLQDPRQRQMALQQARQGFANLPTNTMQ